MPSAVQSRKSPRLASENDASSTVVDDSFTMSVDQAADWLGLDSADIRRLVTYTQLNAENGIEGPLKVTATGQSVTLRSLFSYRRQLVAAARANSL